jgi:hypothetical protein
MRKRVVSSIALFVLLLVFSVPFADCSITHIDGLYTPHFFVSIENPVAGEIINGNNFNLTFSIGNNGYLYYVTSISYNYSLDGQLWYQNEQTIDDGRVGLLDADVVLTNLTQGPHTIRVYAKIWFIFGFGLAFEEPTASVNFFVYRGILPEVSILDLAENGVNQTMFNVTVNEPNSTVSYCLDGRVNVTLPQTELMRLGDSYAYNVTLSGLHEGGHTLTAYVKDLFNHTAMTEQSFEVGQTMATLTMVAVTGVLILLFCTASLLLLRRRKLKLKN